MTEVDDLTPVAQDFVKVIWSAIEWGDPPITTSALAQRFSTSSAAVSATLRRLADAGLVHYEPYRPVVLTAEGARLAIAMVRRHRLIETFLAEIVGYGWDEVHDEAERLEHAVSDVFIERIDALLGHPQADPHGDRIPTASGRPGTPRARRLSDVPPGVVEVLRVSDAHPNQLTRLGALGILPGRELIVTGTPPVVRVRGCDDPVALTAEDLRSIRTVPVDPGIGT